MIEILVDNFFLVLYAITWVLSIIKLPKYFDSTLKYLPILIGYTLFTEILGALIYNISDFTLFSDEEYESYTLLIYNIYDLCFFPYFFYIYWKSLNLNPLKKIIKYGAYIFITSLLVNALFVNPMLNELWYAYTIGSTVLIVACCAYMHSLWSDAKNTSYSTNLLFWISIGLLVFHLGYAPITIYKNLNSSITTIEFNNTRTIHIGLIVLMYTSFIIGFIRMKRFKL